MGPDRGFMLAAEAARADARPPLDAYYRAFEARKVPPSALRREILSFLWHDGGAWGPYEIAARLSRDGARAHPNSVYRAIRSLEAARLVIPIVSWSRFLLSPDPDVAAWCAILCATCRRFAVTPMDEEGEALRLLAAAHGFRPEQLVIECSGRCPACRGDQPAQRLPSWLTLESR